MADQHAPSESVAISALMAAYFAKFGDDADFDRWTMTPDGTTRLMQEALQRGTPVTEQDMQRVYKDLFGEDFPDYPEDVLT
jgi:hypothetical protein